MKVKDKRKLCRPPQSDNWKTPDDFYNKLDARFNFDFDPCPLNHDISLWDGLEIEWGERNFVNPPYSRKLKEAFIKKAFEESLKGKLCVLLLPAATDTKIFHEYILGIAQIEFVEGRLRFEGYNNKGEFCNAPAQKGSMIVIYDGRNMTKEKIIEEMDRIRKTKGWVSKKGQVLAELQDKLNKLNAEEV